MSTTSRSAKLPDQQMASTHAQTMLVIVLPGGRCFAVMVGCLGLGLEKDIDVNVDVLSLASMSQWLLWKYSSTRKMEW